MKKDNPPRPPTFQELILKLQQFWANEGCVILQPYDMPMGAGTFHPATFLRAVGPERWSAAYVQPSRRPCELLAQIKSKTLSTPWIYMARRSIP